MRRWIAGRKHHWTWWNLDLNLRRAVKMAHLHLHVQATGYALLISLLERNREDFDQFLVFWRCFLSPQGLMYWQLLRHGEEVRAGRRCFTPIAAQGVIASTPVVEPGTSSTRQRDAVSRCLRHGAPAIARVSPPALRCVCGWSRALWYLASRLLCGSCLCGSSLCGSFPCGSSL